MLLLRSRRCVNPLCKPSLRLSSRDFSTITSANGVPVPSPLPSTIAQKKGCNLMVDFLINSLGFSRDEAVSVSSKVSSFKFTQNPQLIINLFQQVGELDQIQIKDIVFSVPRILRHRPQETLEPNIRALRDLGLSGSDLVRLIKGSGNGLDTDIISDISYLRRVMGGSNDKVVKVFNRGAWLLWNNNASRKLPPVIAFFRNHGFSEDQIEKFIVGCPRTCMQPIKWLQDTLHRVEGQLGIPHEDSVPFFYGFMVVCGNSKTTIDKKIGVFRSFDWSDADIFTLVRRSPTILTFSESAIRQKLEFYTHDLEFTPAYMASRSWLFTYSLEKRVKPRTGVLKILKEHKLIKGNQPFSTILNSSEEKFVGAFVLPYKDEVPNLYEMYTKN